MDIKPIKSEPDYHNALAMIETIFEAKPGTEEGDRLDVLVTLVHAYEEAHFPIDTPDPVEAIQFVMEQRNMKRKDLEMYIGSSARVSEVLNHKRDLSMAMIRKLHSGLGIPAEILIRENRIYQ